MGAAMPHLLRPRPARPLALLALLALASASPAGAMGAAGGTAGTPPSSGTGTGTTTYVPAGGATPAPSAAPSGSASATPTVSSTPAVGAGSLSARTPLRPGCDTERQSQGDAPGQETSLRGRDRDRRARRAARPRLRRLGARATARVRAPLVALAAPRDRRGGLPRVGHVGRIHRLGAARTLTPRRPPGARRAPFSGAPGAIL